MAEPIIEVSWHCPTCDKEGKVGFYELGVSSYLVMGKVKLSHRAASPKCKVSYPNFSSPHPPTTEAAPSLPKVYSIAMPADEVFFVCMAVYLAQCLVEKVTPYPMALSAVHHWHEVVGRERLDRLSGKLQKISQMEDMETVLHIFHSKT